MDSFRCQFAVVLLFLVLPLQARAAPRSTSSTANRAYLRSLQTVLQGIHDRSQRMSRLRRAANRAQRIRPQDATIVYALGLVLHSRQQFAAAAAQYDAALKRDSEFLPAWKALFHLRLSRGESKTLRSDLQRFIRQIAEEQPRWTDKARRREGAVLLGRVFGFLAISGVELMDDATLKQQRDAVERRLNPQLTAGFREGIESVARERKALESKIERRTMLMRIRSREKANAKLDELKDRSEDIEQKAESLRRSAEEWKSWIDKRLQKADTRLGVCRKDYLVLDAAARRFNRLITQTRVETGRLQTEYELRGLPRRIAMRQPALLQRQQEILRYQRQVAGLRQRAAGVIARARTILAARSSAIQRYQQATGKIVKRDAMLKRWKQAVKNSALKTKEKAGQPQALNALRQKLTSPGSYLQLDFKAEADRLLKSTGRTS